MAWRVATSLLVLRDQLNTLYPNRSKASDGTIGDAAHAAGVSDHNPNSAGVVTAFDITHDPANGLDIQVLGETLANSGDARIKYIIANSRIWEDGSWQQYNGSDPHTNHLHLSVSADSSKYDDPSPWALGGKGANMEKSTPEMVSEAFQFMVLRNPSQDELNKYVGQALYLVYQGIDQTEERKSLVGKLKDYDHLYQTATGLQEELRVAKLASDTAAATKLKAIKDIVDK